MDFNGKVAIVTGSALGIGRAISLALAEQGADIAGFDIRPVENIEMVEGVKRYGGRAIPVHCDVADKQEVRRAVNETVRAFGRIDILINNAGIFEESPVVNADFDCLADSFERQFGVNARGTFFCTIASLPIMLRQGGGDILNIVTNHVHRDNFAAESQVHIYDASKWAQWSLTETLALELKEHNVRVRGLCPAATDTPMLRSLLPDVTAEQMGELTGVTSLMMPEDVALAVINMLNWGDAMPVGVSPLIIYRDDAIKLATPLK